MALGGIEAWWHGGGDGWHVGRRPVMMTDNGGMEGDGEDDGGQAPTGGGEKGGRQ
jgi:hypothetical protein